MMLRRDNMLSEESTSLSCRCPGCGAILLESDSAQFCPVCLLTSSLASSEAASPGSSLASDKLNSNGGPHVLRVFGEYELLAELGKGGMGTVWLARHGPLDRLVALKMISAGKLATNEARERFYAEARAAARLD